MPDPDAAPPTADDPSERGDRHERVMRAALLFQLQQPQADALDDLLAIYDALDGVGVGVGDGGHDDGAAPNATDEQLQAAARLLADADVADAFFNDAAGLDADRARGTESFARAMAATVDGLPHTKANAGARGAAAWLIAQSLHAQSRTIEVEPHLDDALAADPEFRPALELAAHYASDRGDAPRAMSLARRAGVPADDSWVQMLSSMVPRPRNDLGRNDPCYCGSGRKYKQCHLNNATTSLDDRTGWLYSKGIDHLQDSRWQHRLVEVANALLGVDETTYDSMTFAMTDAVVADLVFVHDGAWFDFVDVRGMLLPDDERALAERWATIPRSIFEVVDIDPGTSVTVREVGGDEPIVVSEKTYSRTALVGDVVYTRIAPVGDTHQFFGGLVPLLDPDDQQVLADLLDTSPDGVAVATCLHEIEAGPKRIVNAEGEDVVFITTTLALPDADADAEALANALDARHELTRADPSEASADASGDASGDETPLPLPTAFGDAGTGDDANVVARWAETVTVKGNDYLRGTITLHDDRVVLRANSDERNTRLRALIDDVLPGATVLSEQRETPDPDTASPS